MSIVCANLHCYEYDLLRLLNSETRLATRCNRYYEKYIVARYAGFIVDRSYNSNYSIV